MAREKLIIWGAGEFGKNTVQCFIPDLLPMEILAVVDRDSKKWGSKLCGIPVISYERMKGMVYDRILICSPKFQEEIYSFLISECEVPDARIEIVEDCAYFIYRRMEEKYKYVDTGKINDLSKREAVQYVKCHGAGMFCGDFVEKYIHNRTEIIFDEEEKLNYILHEGKRLYFSPNLQGDEVIRRYYNSLCMEQDNVSPHLYQSDRVKVETGDVVLDVGAAEGFFALSVIEKASFVYMIEADEAWTKALEATFRPYAGKIKLVNGFAADMDIGNQVTIDGVIENEKLDFVKMDIEGAERSALKGAVSILKRQRIKCSICTYHNEEDYEEIKDFLENLGHQTEGSDGYILCTGMWEKDNRDLDFRRGIIRSRKG